MRHQALFRLSSVLYIPRVCARIYFSFATIFANQIFFVCHFLKLRARFWVIFCQKRARFWGIFRKKKRSSVFNPLNSGGPGRVAQSVTCLATDACLTADPGVASSILARYHTFVEIDHEIISMVILLPSADLFKKGCCQLQAKVCAQITG